MIHAEQQLCESQDENYAVVRLVIAKITIYGHRHLLDHLRGCKDKSTKLRYLEQWKRLEF